MKHLNKLKNKRELLSQVHVGLERETLRLTKGGKLSKRCHPKALGSPLTHPYFGTDFGEAQLEWNTPPMPSLLKTENFLHDLMAYTAEVNPQELFWPYSMPCPLTDEIMIARYGSSHEGRKKELYRKGLCYRYGEKLQMISSLHYNFSFGSPFWDFLYDLSKSSKTKQAFINDCYFQMIRNFLCDGWILTYLFGASPAMHKTYAKKIPKGFKAKGSTFYHPYATSIRMSYLGYYSRIQNQLTLSFKDLESYLKDMEFAISTPYSEYQKIGTEKNGEPIQVNNHFLQIENEHYGRIRPKRRLHKGETPLAALKNRGVEYVEVRSIDVDPFSPLGIGKEQLLFLHQFLLYCLLKEGSTLSEDTRCCLIGNQQRIALEGRKKGLELKRSRLIPMEDWAREIFSRMEPIAECLGHQYVKNLQHEQDKIESVALTPSARILEELKNQDLENFGLKWAKIHQKTFQPVTAAKKKHFQQTVLTSTDEQEALETASEILLEGYEGLELSTQVLMKEALKQGIEVEVLDYSDNFIQLKKGSHIEFIKQATKTSQDSYISAHLMENKHITKKILREHGFSIPNGNFYTSLEKAKSEYPLYKKQKIVVKPKSTNFGTGISFVQAHDEKSYFSALKEAFQHDHSVIVESYHPGKEYRFLIIDGKTEGVVHRIPAHVIGDGIHTIKELVHLKNHDPSFYRTNKTHLRLTRVEKEMLRSQKLSIDSIPPKKKQIFLRKNSNVSTGGDAIDMTDDIHESYLKIAAKATKALNTKICGVDILISSPRQAATQNNHTILELNYNPVLFFHAFPNIGKKRNVAKPLLRLLGF